MDLESQRAIKQLADEDGRDNVVVILGSPDPESAEIAAETVVIGDPTYAGPLAEAQLGLAVYHILEDEIRRLIPEDVFEEQVGVMADVLEADGISEAVSAMRSQA